MAFELRCEQDIADWYAECDVAVVGFGGAGACAALEAAHAGATVAVFEAASAPGGSTALSSAELYLGGGTAIQRACGYDDHPDDVYGYLMDANGPQADAEKVRAYADDGADHLDWLMAQGVPFKASEYPHRAMLAMTDDCLLYTGSEKAWPYNDRYKHAPRGHNLHIEGDNGGPLLMDILSKKVRALGVDVHCDARALHLVVDRFGPAQRVIGVVIREDMVERAWRVHRGVVLCAGGFVMNNAMVQRWAPELLRATVPIGNANDTGGGIQLGLSAGAAAINMHEGFVSLPFYPPASLTYGILVNGQGLRFINEDAYHGRVGSYILRQQGPVYFILNVEDYGDYEQVSYLGAPVAGTGETLAELAEELALPSGQLEATIARYNGDIAQGADALFHKASEWLKPLKGPLVAIDCTPGKGAYFPYFTLGGLDTTVDGQVRTPRQSVIPGLYAAGRTACGIPRRGDGYASGTSIGDATYSGRRAGRHAAQLSFSDAESSS